MSIRNIRIVTCDVCNEDVADGDYWIDYGYAGVVFHLRCLVAMSAMEFIALALENGDQMFVNDKTDTSAPHVELKHIWSSVREGNVTNAIAAYRMSYPS